MQKSFTRTWGTFCLTAALCHNSGPQHETGVQVGVGFALRRWLTLIVVVTGWGWDDDMPLRPWPQWVPSSDSDERGGCFGLCGFWVNAVVVREGA